MKIKWYAHAAFRLEGEGLGIVVDPYTPEKSGFAPIEEPADIVVRCAHDDSAHGNADMVRGNPDVVTATWILDEGATVRGLKVSAIPTKESMIHKLEPRDNAMYRFTLGGVRVLHFGDVGNQLTDEQLGQMHGADVAIVPTGGPPTIELDDLCEALKEIKPKITIPMHHALPGCKFPKMLPVEDFTNHFPAESVVWCEEKEVELSPDGLPESPQIWVLKSTHAG
ncbi:MAG: MBL fold metallo-hydrolase [Candidatus Latescibacterota bacterium]|nr:MBL fold metallo-hydrolase [Candidatus Latescibacterota bacterium]